LRKAVVKSPVLKPFPERNDEALLSCTLNRGRQGLAYGITEHTLPLVSIHLHILRHLYHELNQPVIQEGHAGFQRIGHAHAIDLYEVVIRQHNLMLKHHELVKWISNRKSSVEIRNEVFHWQLLAHRRRHFTNKLRFVPRRLDQQPRLKGFLGVFKNALESVHLVANVTIEYLERCQHT